ncbi:tetratricopeptide repeat-containing sensor histidine kinase [Marivirga tractuosa]|uniref:tetratricopeptide repeat-containing sensor histidine kinase n=1 Tax=Marivirga tractuosa TaxID=1006 RepID=UPI0002FFA7DA|nr:tetratricopeptide repeat-containing sensor histidine kinase [Marivirga tractuosa]
MIINFTIGFDQDVKAYSHFLQKGDSSLSVQDYSSAVHFYSKIEEGSISFKSEKEKLTYFLNFSDALYTIGDYPDALVKYEKLKALAIQNQNRNIQGQAHIGIAHSLWRMTDNVRSIEEILTGIEIFKELKDTSNLITASNILAGIYVSLNKFDEAKQIYQEMLENAIRSNDSANIAGNFEYVGIVDFFQGDFESAIRNYEKSLQINQKLNNAFGTAINISNLAESYLELGQYEKAKVLLHQSTDLQEKHQFKSVLIFSYYTLGKVYTELQAFDSGIYYYENSLEMMDETSEIRDRQEVYRLIAENYAKQGAFETAYKYHQFHSIAKDSLIASERSRELEEIKTRYEVEDKIRENNNLIIQNSEKQKELAAQKELIQLQYFIGASIAIFLIISIFLAYKLYKARQTLLNANKSKDRLFGIIAHDLKGPIGNIEAMLTLLQKEESESRKSLYVDYLTKSVQNLSLLTSQLLSWTFSRSGDFDFTFKKLNIREIAGRSIALFDYQLAGKRIKIINSIDKDLVVLADENALLTVFRNILSNSVKFTDKGGEIRLDAEKHNSFVQVRIRDNGVGMSKIAIQKVLEGKHVVSSSGTENEKGSGLGFSIVIEFVRKLKGKINIDSDGENGTTVIIQLKKA